MPTLNICPQEIDICISRGDSTPMTFQMQTSAGVDINIAGRSYLLSVDTLENPTDALTQEFQLMGTEASPLVTFIPTVANTDMDPDLAYFYDIQETNGAALRTVAKGKFTVKQDITK